MSSRVIPVDSSTPRQFRNLRRNSEHLPPLFIPNNERAKETEEETRKEGEVLFKQFVSDQLKKETDIETPQELREQLEICTPDGYQNPAWAKAGRELRMVADDFMQSKEREKVRQQAFNIAQTNQEIHRDQFFDLLSELLHDGISAARIVALFCFCADVAIALLKENSIQLCTQLVQWSFAFILERVCKWVHQNGGWGAVLNMSMKAFLKGAVVVGVAGIFGYVIYKVWNS